MRNPFTELNLLRSHPICLLAALLLGTSGFGVTGCVKSNFSGEASKKKPASEDASKQDAGDTDDADDSGGSDFNDELLDGSDNGSDSDSGTVIDEEVDCTKGAVTNPDETYDFPSNDEVRAFVNSHCDVGIPTDWATQGAVRADQSTMDKVCRLKGFEKAEGFDTKNWASPGDNHMAWWDDASRSFVLKSSSTGNNYYIGSLTCKGRVHESCSEELNKEKCQYN